MTKKIIRLTESDLHKLVRESIVRFLMESDESPGQLEQQVKELKKQEDALTRQIKKANNMFGHTPELWERRAKTIEELTGKREEIRKQKIDLNRRIKELQGSQTPNNQPSAAQTLAKKRGWSEIEAMKIEANVKAEKKYQELLRSGYLIIPNGRTAIRMSDGRMSFSWNSRIPEWLNKHIAINHPEKKLEVKLLPRKKERKQLDDEFHYDVKLILVDNNMPTNNKTTGNSNVIKFSSEDIPYDTSNY